MATKRAFVVLASTLLLVTGTNGLASALDQGNLGTAGPKSPTIERDFLPIPGPFIGSFLPTQPFALFRPTACRNVVYCDAFELDVDYPDDLLSSEVLFGVSVTLTWENPRTEDNATGNDLDMFLFADDDPVLGAPISKCQSPEDDKCDNLESETIAIAEPDNTVADEEATPLLFTVVNHSGVNLGYKLTIKWYTFDLPPPPDFEAPEIGEVGEPNTTVSGPFDFAVTGSKEDDDADAPRRIEIPGPDGQVREIELPFFAAGQRAAASADRGVSPWITAAIVGALVLVGFSWLLVVRSRRREEAENSP